MKITIQESKKNYKVVPFKIAPETFDTLKKIKKATNRSYADIFNEMSAGYYEQVLQALKVQKPEPERKRSVKK